MADFKVVGKLVIDDKGQLGILDKKAKKTAKSVDKVGTSAHTADRRLKGAANASSGASKNFSKMAQGINGGLVPAYATLAASLFAIGALFRGLEEAANIKNQTKGMEIFGEATGIAMKGIVSDLRAATGGMLDFRTAAQQAQIATAAGFNAEQIKELGKGAKLASVALGRDLTDSFNRLLRGVTKAEPELLDELGIILRIDDATRKYAQANDLVASKLTISQRRAAVFEEVSRQLANNFSAFEDGADGALNSFSKLQVAFSDIIKGLTAFIGPLEFVAEFLAANTGAAALIFAGFASSIMKSAFPALTDLNKALDSYASNSKLKAQMVTNDFKQQMAVIRQTGKVYTSTEALKTKAFQKALAKRKIDNTAFENMKIRDQERSLRAMIGAMTRKLNAGKKINMAEYNHLKKVHAMMVADANMTYSKIAASAKIAGAGIKAGIVLPAVAAQTGLAQVGKAALRLGPVFAALGSVINAAFFIFTAGFIVKFLYDALFVTKQDREERAKINDILESSAEKLEEINRISKKVAEGFADAATSGVDKMNKSLLQTYNLVQGLGGDKMVSDYRTKITYDKDVAIAPKLSGEERASLASQIMSQIGALEGLDKLPEDTIQSFRDLAGRDGFFIDGYKQFANQLTAAINSGGLSAKELTKLTETLTKALKGDAKGESLLNILINLNDTSKKVASKGEGLYNVNTAAKEVKDTLATIGDGYKPTTFDTLNSQFKELQTNLDAAIKSGDGGYFAAVEDQLGMSRGALGDNVKALEFVEARALAISQIIQNNAKILDKRSSIAVSTASLGGRKDAGAVLLKQKLKEDELANSILEITNNIRKEEEILLLRGEQGDEVAQRKLRTLERQLKVLEAQDREYKRANTIAGQLQDTFRDGLDDMFLSIIDGTTKAKDAFKQLAVVVIQEMQRILAVRMAGAIINAMANISISGSGSGSDTPPPKINMPDTLPGSGGYPGGGRYGGVFGKGYAAGGIADGPDSGYNVLMHGREAIVPLPDGDKIPVQLSGKGAGPVNSVINITVNNEGETEMNAQESSEFGEAIQAAIQREIAEQQRPGGLLSPI